MVVTFYLKKKFDLVIMGTINLRRKAEGLEQQKKKKSKTKDQSVKFPILSKVLLGNILSYLNQNSCNGSLSY